MGETKENAVMKSSGERGHIHMGVSVSREDDVKLSVLGRPS